MFKLLSSDHYYFPVSGAARDDEGNIEKFSFTAAFRRIKPEVIEKIGVALTEYKRALEIGYGIDVLEEKYRDKIPFQSADLAAYVWAGWKNDGKVVDADGNEIPYSEELRQQFLERDGVPQAIVSAWMESINLQTGKPEGAKTKNSERRGFTG